MLKLTPIKALETNYIWLLTNTDCPGKALIVDPGDARSALQYLDAEKLELVSILLTHHHADHIGGAKSLQDKYTCPIYANNNETRIHKTHGLKDHEIFTINELEVTFEAIHVPGHTTGHCAYYGHNIVFTGDTLFAAGCGRNFEGPITDLYQSLQKLAKLPDETAIYCGHEYTEQNLRFGLLVEPNNQAIHDKLSTIQESSNNRCTLPSTLASEHLTNVFLRAHLPEVNESAEAHSGKILTTTEDVFSVLRDWKNDV